MTNKEFRIRFRHVSGKGPTEEVIILARFRKEALVEFNGLLAGKRANYNIVEVICSTLQAHV